MEELFAEAKHNHCPRSGKVPWSAEGPDPGVSHRDCAEPSADLLRRIGLGTDFSYAVNPTVVDASTLEAKSYRCGWNRLAIRKQGMFHSHEAERVGVSSDGQSRRLASRKTRQPLQFVSFRLLWLELMESRTELCTLVHYVKFSVSVE
jgi:hypothetical protein